MHPEPAGTIDLLVRRASGLADTNEFVRWALDALTDGFDSKALRQLAGMDSEPDRDRPTLMRLFDTAILELGLNQPVSDEELRREFLRRVADDIVSGARAPLAALDAIHEFVVSPLNHPVDLKPWCLVWGGLDPESLVEIDQQGRVEATLALARQAQKRLRA